MNAHPVHTSRARRDLRWALSQERAAAEQELRRHREIARLIERAEQQVAAPAPLFGTAPWIWQ